MKKVIVYTCVFLLAVLLVFVLILRTKPDWLVSALNRTQSSVELSAQNLSVNLVPFTVQASLLEINTESAQTALGQVELLMEPVSWFMDEEFWGFRADTIDLRDQPGNGPQEITQTTDTAATIKQLSGNALAFKHLEINKLQLNGSKELTLSLNAQQKNKTIQLKLNGQAENQAFSVTGSVTRQKQALAFELLVNSGPNTEAQVAGALAFSDRLELKISQAGFRNDTLNIQDMMGELDWNLDTKQVSLWAQVPGSRLTLKGSLNKNMVDFNLLTNLESSALLPGFSTTIYSKDELLPLKFRAMISNSASHLEIKEIELKSPSHSLKGIVSVDVGEKLKVRADIQAENISIPLVNQNLENPSLDAEQNTSDGLLFNDQKLDWTWLNTTDIELALRADYLQLQKANFESFELQLRILEGTLEIAPFSAKLDEGRFEISAKVQHRAETEDISAVFRMDLDNIDLETFGLLPTEELQGGRTRIKINLAGGGDSMHALANSLNGDILFMLEDAVLNNDLIELAGSDLFAQVISKLNPFVKEDPNTQLQCLLAYLVAENGVLKSDSELVLQTKKMQITGSGQIDMSDESIDITFSPSSKSGVGVNVGSLVKFLKLGGTLRNPSPEADAAGVLKSGAAVGLALSTGGVSILAEGLAKRVLNSGSACETARTKYLAN